ncbi:diguanylate cyclase (GGDEF)-like protein [Duganella sp. SG902]|uniref:ligand-binding sensor domain-containing diguanylate cyclase n=1 Tax=Duganella sp. SG902 TaxID=2587016 RepID=UPI00159DAD49|nr:ligand-binding sensor domain-containing diguanylate cyclase [Duganella sp. SG902]NVM76089.1 diguanylate cyclase (GGDEF)-like protein [Duganella sp. SG902]
MPHSNFHPRTAALARLPRVAAALCLLLCWLMLARPLHAANGERWSGQANTSFKHNMHIDVSSGVCLAQDRQGFLWIGTQAGLVRWDGNRHVKYVADAARDEALPDSYIMSLHVDPQGRLWIGMSSGGLARYDATRDAFVRYRAGGDGLRDPRVSAIADDGAGGLWLATGRGLDHMTADGRFTRQAPAGAALPDGGVDTLLREADGTLWIGTRRGLFQLKPGQPAQQITLGGKTGLSITALLKDSAGRLWIGSRTNGAFSIAPGGDAHGAAAVRESGAQPTLQSERVSAIVEAGPDEIWLGTNGANGGIVVLDARSNTTRRIRHRADAPDSLPDNDIMAMLRERSGIIFTSYMAGISQHDPQPRAITTIRHAEANRGNVLSVPSVMLAPDGQLWLSNTSGGIEIMDPYRGHTGRLTTAAGLPPGRVLAMAPGPDGEVYIGTQHGLYRTGADGRHPRRVVVPTRGEEEEVWALALDGRTLWVGGLDGLWALALPAAGAPRLLRHEDQQLGDPRVTAVLPVGDDVWVGTRGGLARLGPDAVERIPTELAVPDRLPPGYVSSLALDRRGRLWMSNFGTGVVMLERTDPDGRRRFRRLGMQQGLPDSGANKLLLDREGMLWASTDAGLARIDPEALTIRALGASDGVQVPTYWTNSGAVTAEGELVFGGLSGVSVVKPQALSVSHYAPPMVVTRLLLNDKEIPAAVYNTGLGAKAPPVTVPPAARERGFSLEFAALDYATPERNRYAYQLKGFDSNWVETDAGARRASYNNLPPGDYLLQLRGTNRHGDWSAPIAVPVRVLPAWHQHPLARLAMFVLVILLAAGLLHARTAYLRRRQRELEGMVQARTAELRTIQSQLETLAYGDPLTGLANRRLFNDELRHLVAQAERGGAAFTLLLIDLDHFKQINDSLGHDAGDALLVAAAERLRAAVRESDRAYRLGGDEFAVLLHQPLESGTPAAVCARILSNLAAPLAHGADVIEISASVGAASHRQGDSHEQLYKRADVALYEAKAAGRNTWRLAE